MCNPPFYTSPEEVAKSASEKDFEPYAVSIFISDSEQ
jgi:23S rRNA A1618 N6-methylase RlmF